MRNRYSRLILAGIVLGWLVQAAPAWGQQTPSPSAAVEGDRLPPHSGQASNGNLETQKISRDSDGGWGMEGYLQTLVALAIVVGLVFLTRFMIRRFGGSAAQGGRGEPIEVLTRMPVGVRQQLLLVRLGSKLVLVGQSPGGLRSISEITDPEEIEQLLHEVRSTRGGAFGSLLQRKARESAARAQDAEEESK